MWFNSRGNMKLVVLLDRSRRRIWQSNMRDFGVCYMEKLEDIENNKYIEGSQNTQKIGEKESQRKKQKKQKI